MWAGGGHPTILDQMEYVNISVASNTTDFGELNVTARYMGSSCDGVRGVYSGGQIPTASSSNHLQYIYPATIGDATDFGDLTAVNVTPAAFSGD